MAESCPFIGSPFLEEYEYFSGPGADTKLEQALKKTELAFDGDRHHLKVHGDEAEFLEKAYGSRGLRHFQLPTFKNLGHALEGRAKKTPDQKVYRWLDEKYNETVTYTPLEMERYAKDIADKLTKKYGLVPGDRVALAFLPSAEFVIGFFACAMGGRDLGSFSVCFNLTYS